MAELPFPWSGAPELSLFSASLYLFCIMATAPGVANVEADGTMLINATVGHIITLFRRRRRYLSLALMNCTMNSLCATYGAAL
jgi:hypothetical protein